MAALVVSEGSYTWRVTDWASKANLDCVASETFQVAGKRWCAARDVRARARAVWCADGTVLSPPWTRGSCRCRSLLLYPSGYADETAHLSLFLCSREPSGSIANLASCSFTLVLRGNGAKDVRKAFEGAESAVKCMPAHPLARAHPPDALTRRRPQVYAWYPVTNGARAFRGRQSIVLASRRHGGGGDLGGSRYSSPVLSRAAPAPPRRGVVHFIARTELADPSRGFIQADDRLTFAVEARVTSPPAPPQRPPALQGYDPELFVQQPVADAALCGICHTVMHDPVSCLMGHKYGCLPPRVVLTIPLLR
jgi:hypothetical protein